MRRIHIVHVEHFRFDVPFECAAYARNVQVAIVQRRIENFRMKDEYLLGSIHKGQQFVLNVIGDVSQIVFGCFAHQLNEISFGIEQAFGGFAVMLAEIDRLNYDDEHHLGELDQTS